MRPSRQLDANRVAGLHHAAFHDDRHDATLPDQFTIWSAREYCVHQTLLQCVELKTWTPQACDLDDRMTAQMEQAAFRQSQEVYALSRDVFAHLTWTDHEAFRRELSVQLRVDQVHLPQVDL